MVEVTPNAIIGPAAQTFQPAKLRAVCLTDLRRWVRFPGLSPSIEAAVNGNYCESRPPISARMGELRRAMNKP